MTRIQVYRISRFLVLEFLRGVLLGGDLGRQIEKLECTGWEDEAPSMLEMKNPVLYASLRYTR